jgi:hypothetical protein
MTDFFTTHLTANPQVGHIICRALAKFGPMSDAELRSLLVPSAHVDEEAESSNQWQSTTSVLKGIKLLDEIDGQYHLPIWIENKSLSHREFSLAFMSSLVSANKLKIASDTRPDDLFICIGWLLTVPNGTVFTDFSSGASSPEQLMNLFSLSDMNKTRWDAFCRWAIYLGIMAPFDNGVEIPEVKQIISWFLEGKKFELPMKNFLHDIGRILPILEDASFYLWCEKSSIQPERFSRVGEQLSWALYSLSESGQVHLENRDDGSQQYSLNISTSLQMTVNTIRKDV